MIVADRAARTPAGIAQLVELAETLQAPVIDQGGRMNFPSRHPLNQSGERAAADRRRRRHPRSRADRLLGHRQHACAIGLTRTSRSVVKPGTKLISITALDLVDEGQLPGLPALSRSRRRDGGRRRGDAAGADRGVQAADHRRSPQRVSGARQEARRGARRGARARARRGGVRVGREPDQHRAADGGAVGADQERGLVARGRERHHQRLADAAVDVRQALPVARRLRRRGRRLRRAGGGRRRAREQEARPAVGDDSGRRRFHVRARRAGGRRRITGFRCSR